MKKSLILIIGAMLPLCLSARNTTDELRFTVVKENPITSIKNQNRSGTCWCFTGISFLESEAIRINSIKDTANYPDFSEMFVVSHSYMDRAEKYIRMDGNLTFAAGSECEDVLHVVKDYGIVPQSVQEGLNYGTDNHVHRALDAATKAYIDVILTNPNKTLSTAWKKGFQGIVDAYLGKCPDTFEFNGKIWTPASYRDSYKINPDDYVSLTSFTHHPFYTKFALEVSDNWRGDQAYNLPIDEFMNVLFYALEHGYTATWGGDVSEAGFSRTGYALLLDNQTKSTAGSDQVKWIGKDAESEKNKEVAEAPVEQTVTQESRQHGFDFKSTTDDHGMHAFGIAKDQYGIWYLSEAFTKAKALDFIVHKDALPKDLKKKLGIR